MADSMNQNEVNGIKGNEWTRYNSLPNQVSCPSCGYCPTCGRKNKDIYYWPSQQPTYPTSPWAPPYVIHTTYGSLQGAGTQNVQ